MCPKLLIYVHLIDADTEFLPIQKNYGKPKIVVFTCHQFRYRLVASHKGQH
jgi:hypothetical protein